MIRYPHKFGIVSSIPFELSSTVTLESSSQIPAKFTVVSPHNLDKEGLNPNVKPNYPIKVIDSESTILSQQVKSTEESSKVESNTGIDLPIPMPVLVIAVIIIGGLVVFPLIYLVRNANKLMQRSRKQAVSSSDIQHHQKHFDDLSALIAKAQQLHHEKFSSREFLEFFKLKNYINSGVDGYKNLDKMSELLTAAIVTQKSFTVIYQTESSYCSGKQQEFYEYVSELLDKNIDRNEFKELVLSKAKLISEQLKTEKGKAAIDSYSQEIAKIAEHDLGLKLLSIFKQYNFADYSILSTISQTIDCLDRTSLTDDNSLISLVLEKADTFEKLSKILGIENNNNFAEEYSKLLRYIGLKKRHGDSYAKFQALLMVLGQVQPLYQSLTEIRSRYDGAIHQIPQELPGLAMYDRYKHCL